MSVPSATRAQHFYDEVLGAWLMTKTKSGLILTIVFFCSSALLAGADLYVSPKGSDNNPGTQRKPFATLETCARRGALPPSMTPPSPSG